MARRDQCPGFLGGEIAIPGGDAGQVDVRAPDGGVSNIRRRGVILRGEDFAVSGHGHGSRDAGVDLIGAMGGEGSGDGSKVGAGFGGGGCLVGQVDIEGEGNEAFEVDAGGALGEPGDGAIGGDCRNLRSLVDELKLIEGGDDVDFPALVVGGAGVLRKLAIVFDDSDGGAAGDVLIDDLVRDQRPGEITQGVIPERERSSPFELDGHN